MESLWPFIEKHPKYAEHGLLERLVEPERAIQFRVSWQDDHGTVHVNRASASSTAWPSARFWAASASTLGEPVRCSKFWRSSNLQERTGPRCPWAAAGRFGLRPLRARARRSHALLPGLRTELFPPRWPDTDVPAGDIGVGGRGSATWPACTKKLSNRADCVFTGKGLSFGGSLIRPEATGYGTVYFADEMLKTAASRSRASASVSGSGNVAQYAVERPWRWAPRCHRVRLQSAPWSTAGFTPEKLAILMDVKNHQYGRVSDYAARFPARRIRGRQAVVGCEGGRRPALRHAERTGRRCREPP